MLSQSFAPQRLLMPSCVSQGPPAPVLDEDNFPALGAAGPSPTKGAAPAWAGSSQVRLMLHCQLTMQTPPTA